MYKMNIGFEHILHIREKSFMCLPEKHLKVRKIWIESENLWTVDSKPSKELLVKSRDY